MSSRQDDEEEESSEVTVNEDTDRPALVWDKIKVKSSTIYKTLETMDPETPKPQGKDLLVLVWSP